MHTNQYYCHTVRILSSVLVHEYTVRIISLKALQVPNRKKMGVGCDPAVYLLSTLHSHARKRTKFINLASGEATASLSYAVPIFGHCNLYCAILRQLQYSNILI
jgi:hypothetical protein